ncbi:MAG: SsrA-binding protein SmpB [Nitrospinota bacterium]
MAGGIKIICENRKARHDYTLEESFEAGLVLQGSEVKSLRAGRAHLKDSYADVRDEEVYLIGTHISPYDPASDMNHDPERDRKLLLHHREIRKLIGKVKERGLTLIPLKMYFKGGKAKVEIALARGKKSYDKRETLKRKEAEREVERAMKTARHSKG